MSLQKLPAASSLPGFWDDNSNAMFALVERAHSGIKGFVRDAVTDEPIDNVLVRVVGNDKAVRTRQGGQYYRLLLPDTYELTFSADGYVSGVANSVVVEPTGATIVPIMRLQPIGATTTSSLPSSTAAPTTTTATSSASSTTSAATSIAATLALTSSIAITSSAAQLPADTGTTTAQQSETISTTLGQSETTATSTQQNKTTPAASTDQNTTEITSALNSQIESDSQAESPSDLMQSQREEEQLFSLDDSERDISGVARLLVSPLVVALSFLLH